MTKKLRILAASDIHGNLDLARRLSEKARKNKVDLVLLAGDISGFEFDKRIIKTFNLAKQKVVFVPGNWDLTEDVYAMKPFAKNLHNYYVTYGEVGITGIGNPNWKFSLDYNDFENIKKNFEKMKSKKRILVSHLHAQGTKAEFSGVIGDKILRKAVDDFKPDLLISAHIHESEGLEDKIGKTKIVQVGRMGKIIEV